MAGRPKRRARLARQKRERARRTRSNPMEFRGSPNDTWSELYGKNKDNEAALTAIAESAPMDAFNEKEPKKVGDKKLREIKNALRVAQRQERQTSVTLDADSPYDEYGSRESSSAEQSKQLAALEFKELARKTDLPQNIQAAIMSNDPYKVLTRREAASQGVQPHDVLSTARALYQLESLENGAPKLDLDFDFGFDDKA